MLRRALPSVLFPLALVAQQAAPPVAPATPDGPLATAMEHFAKGATEDGILAVWDALDDLAGADPAQAERAATLAAAQQLLAKHDPLDADRRRAGTAVAQKQVELVRAYRSRKWLDAAAAHLAIADRYDASVGQKERAQLPPRPRAVALREPARDDAKPSLLSRSSTQLIRGSWQVVDGALVAGPHDTTQHKVPFVWMTRGKQADDEIVVEFARLDDREPANLAIVVGDPVGYAMDAHRIHFSCSAGDDQESLSFMRSIAGKVANLADTTFAVRPTVDGYHRLAVRIDGTKVTVRLDTQPAVEWTTDVPLRGFVGLLQGFTKTSSGKLRIRRFEITQPAGSGPTAAELHAAEQARLATELDVATTEIKDLLTSKQNERATVALHALLARLRELDPGAARDTLRKTLAPMANQADTSAAKFDQACAACAKELAAAARKYTTAGMPRAALALAQQAAAFDPDGKQIDLPAAQAAVAKWHAARESQRAAELAPPDDDGAALRDWFANGRPMDEQLATWTVDGAAARVAAIGYQQVTMLLPRADAPAAAAVTLSVHLPHASAEAGLVFDVEGPREFSIAVLRRTPDGIAVRGARYHEDHWTSLGDVQIEVDAWRLDGWFALKVERTTNGMIATCLDRRLLVDRAKLGAATGRIALFAANDNAAPAAIEVRAFRVEG